MLPAVDVYLPAGQRSQESILGKGATEPLAHGVGALEPCKSGTGEVAAPSELKAKVEWRAHHGLCTWAEKEPASVALQLLCPAAPYGF